MKKARCIQSYETSKGFQVKEGSIYDIRNRKYKIDAIYYGDMRICDVDSIAGETYFEIIEEEKKMGEMGKNIWFEGLCMSSYLTEMKIGNKQGMFDRIENVFYNEEKRTVVIKWKDGTTTKSTCYETDYFDPFVGFCIAYTVKDFSGKAKLKAKIMRMFEKSKKRGK